MKQLTVTPLEASRVEEEVEPPLISNCSFKKKKVKYFFCGSFFLGAIFLGRVVVPSLKIVITLPRAYSKKLYCKGEPYRFRG